MTSLALKQIFQVPELQRVEGDGNPYFMFLSCGLAVAIPLQAVKFFSVVLYGVNI